MAVLNVILLFFLLTMEGLSILSLNVNGLRDNTKRRKIFNYLNNTDHNIFYLQETHSDPIIIKKWSEEWQGKTLWSSGSNFKCGVAILFSKNCNINILKSLTDNEGRMLGANIQKDNTQVQLINIYSPNKPQERPQFFLNISKLFDPKLNIILGGDFNMVQNINMDRAGGTPSPTHLSGSIELQNILDEHKLCDIWRALNKNKKEFTWENPNKTIKCRIDRLYISKNLTNQIETTNILPIIWSDHKYITIKIKNNEYQKKGPNFWKLNTSILQEENYNVEMEEFWKFWQTQKQKFAEITTWWDMGKKHIQSMSIIYCTDKQKQKKRNLRDITNKIEKEKKENNPNPQLIKNLQTEMINIQNEMNKGVFTRSKEKMIEEGETPTKFFFLQEQIKQKKKHIKTLENDQGETIKDPKQILKLTKTYYEDLHKKFQTSKENQNILLENITTKLTNTQSENLSTNFTEKELKCAIDEIQKDKSPGIDGLPIEFYVSFWEIVKHDFMEVVNQTFQNNKKLSPTQRSAVITLIPKKDNLHKIENWRPISLLCADYKIITKTIANRLKPILKFLINDDQTCSVQNRNIHSNIFLFRDVIKYAEEKKINSFLLTFDQEKAFDKVDRDFLYRILKKMNFDEKFINIIKTLYTDNKSCIINNGFLSSFFKIERGVRQGCPASLPFYCLYAEALSSTIRNNKKIIGFPVPGAKEKKLSQYADDLTLIISNPISLKHIFKTINIFHLATGGTTNKKKTKAMAIGGFDSTFYEKKYPIEWVDNLKLLGITFFIDITKTINHNYTKCFTQLEKQMSILKNRNLSLKGKSYAGKHTSSFQTVVCIQFFLFS